MDDTEPQTGLRTNPSSLAPEDESLATRVSRLTPEERQAFFATIPEAVQARLMWDWEFFARPKQLEGLRDTCTNPECKCGGQWRSWLCLAGRGWGKTRVGAEWCRRKIEQGVYKRINVVGATAADTRDIIVEGPSGLLSVFPPEMGAKYSPTKRKVSFDSTEAVIMCFSADEPERLRGHQCDAAWVDELAAWRRMEDAWTQLMLGLRLGPYPRVIITTTPKPLKLIKDLLKSPSTHVTRGTTWENVDNLAPTFINEIIRAYQNTRIGEQELYARILDQAPGALWHHDMLAALRVTKTEVPPLRKIVVAVDPAVAFDADEGDETGIIVAGVGENGEGYILEDLSGRMKADEWARRTVRAYHRWDADRVVAEVNQGGDLVERSFKVIDPDMRYSAVHATKGKLLRAEPVAALYEQKRVHHVGTYEFLEDQMCSWEPGEPKSPDRLDALVWALTYLMVDKRTGYWARLWTPDPALQGRNYWTQGVG